MVLQKTFIMEIKRGPLHFDRLAGRLFLFLLLVNERIQCVTTVSINNEQSALDMELECY